MTVEHTLSAPDPRALALHTLAIDFAVAYERRLPSQRVQVLDMVTRELDAVLLIEERAEIMAGR